MARPFTRGWITYRIAQITGLFAGRHLVVEGRSIPEEVAEISMLIVEYESDRMEDMVTVTLKSKDFIYTDEKSALLLKDLHDWKITKMSSA